MLKPTEPENRMDIDTSTDTSDDPRTWHRPGVTVMWSRIARLTPITERQREVLAFVVDHIERHGYAPSVREVGDHFGWSSTRTAGEHLHELARKGALQITPGVARGILVLDDSGIVRADPRPVPVRPMPACRW